MSYCGDFSEVYIKLPICSLQDFKNKAALVLNDFKTKVGEKYKTLVHRVVAEYLRKVGEFRSQFSL